MTTDPIAIRALIVAPFHETETTWDVGDLSEAKDAAWKRNRLNDRKCSHSFVQSELIGRSEHSILCLLLTPGNNQWEVGEMQGPGHQLRVPCLSAIYCCHVTIGLRVGR